MKNLVSCVVLVWGTGLMVAGFIWWGIAWMTYEPYEG